MGRIGDPSHLGDLRNICMVPIGQMLTLDPMKRISSEEALKHPWLSQRETVTNKLHRPKNLKGLLEFDALRKFKGAAWSVLFSQINEIENDPEFSVKMNYFKILSGQDPNPKKNPMENPTENSTKKQMENVTKNPKENPIENLASNIVRN